jgi:chromosome segregation ATPase
MRIELNSEGGGTGDHGVSSEQITYLEKEIEKYKTACEHKIEEINHLEKNKEELEHEISDLKNNNTNL